MNGVHIRPDEHWDVESHVVDPQADDDGHGCVDFETRSTELAYSQESTKCIVTVTREIMYPDRRIDGSRI